MILDDRRDALPSEVLVGGRLPTNPRIFEKRFAGRERMLAAIEAGTHSPWVSRLLKRSGQE